MTFLSKFPQDSNAHKLQFLSSLYHEHTRVTNTSATLIDLFFTHKRRNILQSGVLHIGISGHSLIYAVRKFCLPKSRESTKRKHSKILCADIEVDMHEM